MSIDSSILEFSKHFFRLAWVKLDFVYPYDGLEQYDGFSSSCSDDVIRIVLNRLVVFESILVEKMRDYYEYYFAFDMDYYLFLKGKREVFIPNENMIVFDKIFMIAAVILKMCIFWKRCNSNRMNDIKDDVHKVLALYIETEFKKEFCDSGGFAALDRYIANNNVYFFRKLNDFSAPASNEGGVKFIYDWFQNSNYMYDLDMLISTFYERLSLNLNNKVCMSCQPYFYALCYCKFKGCDLVDEFQLVECFLTLISKMHSKSEIKAILGLDWKLVDDLLTDEGFKRYFLDFKLNNTREYQERLFSNVDENCPSSCMFCGSIRKGRDKSTIAAESSIRKTVKVAIAMHDAILEASEETSDFPADDPNTVQDSPEINHMRRLFITLGANVTETEEFVSHSLQIMEEERELLKAEEERRLEEERLLEEERRLEERRLEEERRLAEEAKKKKKKKKKNKNKEMDIV